MDYAHTKRFCVVQENTKSRGLKSKARACEVCALRQRALYFPVQQQTGYYDFDYLIASYLDSYHSLKHVLLLSRRLSLLQITQA